MYLYKVSFSDYDWCSQYELTHSKLFTQEQFDAMIIEASLAIVKQKKAVKDSLHDFGDIIWEVVNYLREKYGFVKIEYDAVWDCQGDSMFTRHDEIVKWDRTNTLAEAMIEAGYVPAGGD